MTARRLGLTLTLLAASPAALAAPGAVGPFAYLKGGAAWVVRTPGFAARPVPNAQGAALLSFSPKGTLAFLTGPAGVKLHAQTVPALRPWLSRPPYTRSEPLSALVPGKASTGLRARWLRWSGGQTLIAGGDDGTLGWNLTTRSTFRPGVAAQFQSSSADGDVTAALGSIRSPDDVGVLLYGPGARPGTEVFSRRLPETLMRALKAAPQPDIRAFLRDLDAHQQAEDRNWTVTTPQVTRGGQRVFFASNAGYGVGSAGRTSAVIFQVDVDEVRLQALGWLGVLSGSVQNVLPSPDGRRLLIVMQRGESSAQVSASVVVADLDRKTRRELVATGTPPGTLAVLDSACWLADSRHVALSVAYPRPGDLGPHNSFTPPAAAHTLLVRDAASGAAVHRVLGATGVACGPA